MYNHFTKLIFLFLLFSGCEKSETIELKGTLKGKIYSISELGYKSYFRGMFFLNLMEAILLYLPLQMWMANMR